MAKQIKPQPLNRWQLTELRADPSLPRPAVLSKAQKRFFEQELRHRLLLDGPAYDSDMYGQDGDTVTLTRTQGQSTGQVLVAAAIVKPGESIEQSRAWLRGVLEPCVPVWVDTDSATMVADG